MFLVTLLLYLMFLHEIVTFSQINLDRTEWMNNNDNNLVLQHDCLHTTISNENENDPHEIISYCMSEWPSKWNIKTNNFDQYFTFAELYKRNITSEQLYFWSAPMDIVENYQLYRNDILVSSMGNELFYNCTLPRFGSICQYTFDDYKSNSSSLNEFLRDFYHKNKYQPTNLTCYIHLPCHRGAHSTCLDWTEICDGKIDCLNNAIDEEQCWQLEIHECLDEEFRCDIGQCIYERFLHDNPNIPDCLDGTDEVFLETTKRFKCSIFEPSFACEDVICTSKHWLNHLRPLTSSCLQERTELLLQAIFSEKPNSISDDCWTAFKCTLHMPVLDDPACRILCANQGCVKIIHSTCPEMLFVPTIPILFGHIHFAYMKNHSRYSNNYPQFPQYICYNDQLCDGFLANKTLISFNNMTCRTPRDFPLKYELVTRNSWLHMCVAPYYKQLYKCNTIIRNDSNFCQTSNMYQCINSSKCISKYRIYDGFTDCNYNDDENPLLLEDVYSIQGLKRFFKCTTNEKYIPRNHVGDDSCDCGQDEYLLCDDEWPEQHYIKKQISFSTICDGFTELIPINTTEGNETDETGCEYWPCNNTYTRCDGFWNCLNGADEIDCHSSPLINCPPRHHICISIETKQLMCLSLAKANDGKIDCLGGTDEPELCRAKDHFPSKANFYCRNDPDLLCRSVLDVCAYGNVCLFGIDTQSCRDIWNVSLPYHIICQEQFLSNRSAIEKYICSLFDDIQKPKIVHFFLERPNHPMKNIQTQEPIPVIPRSSIVEPTSSQEQSCHRGLPLRVWLDREKNSTTITCLCPPSFYGEICQYQNQRVALTMKFQPFALSRRIPFTIIITLIDDSDERTIHSHHQLTYLPMQHCQIKFNIYLLYSTRPKNETKHYSIHIDFYEKISLKYQGSALLPIHFAFLPVYRIGTLLHIPYTTDSISSCTDRRCIHGSCMKYFKDMKNTSFCQCDHEWSGQFCTIPHTCVCSGDSLCIGISAKNRSICVCPINKWGSRCLLHHQICHSNQNRTLCYNGGQCIPLDPYVVSKKTFECICPKGYFGDRCEIENNKMILSFEKDIILPQSLLVHFIQVMDNTPPEFGNTFKHIPIYENSTTIFWSRPFHIAFVELLNKNYYLILIQKSFNSSMIIYKTLKSTDRCWNTNELFNQTFLQLHLLIRMKSYHLLCQRNSFQLACFYDEIHMCFCVNYGDQRHANCLQFNHTFKRDCSGQSHCENGAQCLQDSITCPKTSICHCPSCFHGRRCQFHAERFDLSLDAILGYHIGRHIGILQQSAIIQTSIVITIIMTLAGLVNGVLSIMTFNNESIRKTGCGLYLLSSSIITTVTMIIFALKFWILLIAQMIYITNRSFLYVQCISLDFFLRIGLNMDQWLNACTAIERVFIALNGLKFNQKKSKKMAKYIILILLLLMISTAIHDPFHRRLIDDGDEDEDDQRIWCSITYSHNFQIYNSVMNIFHFFVPFCINFISAIVIIIATTRQRLNCQPNQNYRQLFYEQLKIHQHLLIASSILVILAIPRLIITFVSGCMKSSHDSWLFLVGYLISFIPPVLTFVVFVLPSTKYKDEFEKCVRKCRRRLRMCFHLVP